MILNYVYQAFYTGNIKYEEGKAIETKYQNKITAKSIIYMIIILLSGQRVSGKEGNVNWNQFRGPNGQGVVETGRIAVNFGPGKNLLWKSVTAAGRIVLFTLFTPLILLIVVELDGFI